MTKKIEHEASVMILLETFYPNYIWQETVMHPVLVSCGAFSMRYQSLH